MADRASTGPGLIRRVPSGLLLLIGMAAAIGTIAGFFGAAWWGFDRIADWRLPLAALLLADAVIYGIVFRGSLSAVFLAAALVNGVLLAPMWLGRQAEAEGTGAIRVASLDLDGASGNTPETMAWLEQLDADVVFLHRPGDTAIPSGTIGSLRVLPVADGGPDDAAPLLLVADGTTIASLPTVPGADAVLAVSKGTTAATFVTVAVDAPTSATGADRRLARFALLNAGAGGLDGPVVVTGDLQASRWSHAFDVLAGGFTNSEDGFGYAATWAPFPVPFAGAYGGLPLDHAVYRGAVTVPYRSVGPDLGIGHRPLIYVVAPTSD